MVTVPKTKSDDRVRAAAEAELERAREHREELEGRLEATRQALSDLRDRRRAAFAGGQDTSPLDAELSKAERDVADLEAELDDAKRQEVEAEERRQAALLWEARVEEQELRVRQAEIAAVVHDLMIQADSKVREEAQVLDRLHAKSAEVKRLGGERRDWTLLTPGRRIPGVLQYFGGIWAPDPREAKEEARRRLDELAASGANE